MTNKNNLSIIASWQPVYAQKTRDFNILDSIHLHENDQCAILCDILKLKVNGQRVFLQYFVETVVGVGGFANTQKSSANNLTYNDLEIKAERTNLSIDDVQHGKAIVVESGMSDTKEQVFQAYITDASHKKAAVYSTFTILDVLDWLQDSVLPNCAFSKSGLPISSILLYIDYLKSIVGYADTNSITQESDMYQLLNLASKSPKDCFTALYNAANELENDIANEAKNATLSFDLAVADDLRRSLKQAAAHVYKVNSDWSVNCTPNYISFCPTEWKDRFGGYVTSNIHFQLNNWQNGKPILYFCIQNKACRQYICPMAKYDQTLANQLAKCVNASAPVDWEPQSGHFYWGMTLDMSQKTADEFFQHFAEWVETVKPLLDFVEKQFD